MTLAARTQCFWPGTSGPCEAPLHETEWRASWWWHRRACPLNFRCGCLPWASSSVGLDWGVSAPPRAVSSALALAESSSLSQGKSAAQNVAQVSSVHHVRPAAQRASCLGGGGGPSSHVAGPSPWPLARLVGEGPMELAVQSRNGSVTWEGSQGLGGGGPGGPSLGGPLPLPTWPSL